MKNLNIQPGDSASPKKARSGGSASLFFSLGLAAGVSFFAPVLFVEAADRGAFGVDLNEDLGDAEKLTISGGVVKRAARPTPLMQAFEHYHFESILGLLGEVSGGIGRYVDETGKGRGSILLSGNPAGGFHFGRWVELAWYFNFLNVELDMAGLDGQFAHFLAISALNEAVGSTLLVMPNARSNAVWMEREDPRAYARGTGIAYALGGHMHVPWCLYDGSERNRFYGSLEGHQPIFQMIHENAAFLDGYVPALWHVVEVPYHPDGIGDLKALEAALLDLTMDGVPTVVRLRDWKLLDPRTPDARRESLKTLDRNRFGDDRWNGLPVTTGVLGASGRESRARSPFVMDDDFEAAFLPPIPRVAAVVSDRPVVLHLVRRFEGDTEDVRGGGFRISREFLKGARIGGMDLASVRWEGDSAPEVDWEMLPGGDVQVNVRDIRAWAMLRIQVTRPVQLPGVERGAFRQSMTESEIPLMRMVRFDDTWMRPAWVDKALASGEDPLEGYHITRISWSYDSSPNTIGHAQAKGWAFHGSGALLHSWMLDSEVPTDREHGILKFPADWEGWARYPDGGAMLIRPEWNPPRYGASFASSSYRQAVIDSCKEWIDKGAEGIQLDDVSGMLNRVWQYGGDFSDELFEAFREYLVEREMIGVSLDTPLDDLRQRVVRQMQRKQAFKVIPSGPGTGWISVPYKATSAGYPGEVWISSPPLSRDGDELSVEWEVRFADGHPAHADFQLMNGDRAEWFAALTVRNGTVYWQGEEGNLHPTGITLPVDEWVAIRLLYDLDASTARFALGEADWGEPFPFAFTLPAQQKRVRLNVMANPLRSTFQLRRLVVD